MMNPVFFNSFSYYYRFLRYRILILLLLSLLVGALDGLGLAMFMPLLQYVNDSGSVSVDSLGQLKFLIDSITEMGFELKLSTVLIVMLFFFYSKGIARFFEGYYRLIVQQFFIKKLRFQSIEDLSLFEYKEFIETDAGRIQNTLTSEIPRVIASYKSFFGALQSSAMLLVYMSMAFLANAEFAIMVTLGGGITNLLFRFIYKRTKILSRNVTKDGHDFQGLIIQMVGQFKYLKATGLIFNYAEKLKHNVRKVESTNKKMGFYGTLLNSIREPIVMLVVVLVILLQVNYMGQNFGTIILSLLFFYRSLTFVMNLQMEWNKFLTAYGSLENIKDFHELLYSKREDNPGNEFNNKIESIEIQNISFAYGEAKILNNVSLKIEPRTTVAFVGESGAGKTTLVNIISGLLKPSEGEIILNNKLVLNKFDLNSYRERIGYITQDPVIFNASIYDNITFWSERTESNLKRFKEVLQQASIFDFVQGLPNREDEILGYNGINLSGGQKQRISIARELYKDIDILILDEATAALDAETEQEIKKSLELLRGKLTTLVIAHRFATIRNADRIIILNKGVIEQIGKFDELKNDSNYFNEMVELQKV